MMYLIIKINRIIGTNCIDQLPLLAFILNQSVVPDNAFLWIVESLRSSIELISFLIKQRLWLDQKMDTIIDMLQKCDNEMQSCNDLDRLLTENEIILTIYEKHYLFTLLTADEKQDIILWNQDKPYDCSKSYPVRNISMNYIPTEDLLDDAFCEAARLADYKLMKNILTAAAEHNLQCQFDPENDPEHRKVLSWVQENIIKGCKGEKDLGWSMGPDSAKWPSTELKDYVKTLDCLLQIMC